MLNLVPAMASDEMYIMFQEIPALGFVRQDILYG